MEAPRPEMKAHAQDETTFDKLPCEMQMKIFSHIPIRDRKSGCLVCKQWWYALSWHESMRYKVVLNDWNLKYVQGCTKASVDQLLVGNLNSLALVISHFRKEGIPAARVVTLYPGISATNMQKLLRYYCSTAGVQQLEFAPSSLAGGTGFGRIASRSSASWTALRFLKLEIVPDCSDDVLARGSNFTTHSQAVAEFLKDSSVPQLETLSIVLDYGIVRNFVAGDVHPFEQVYIQLFEFLIRHAAKVKELHMHLKGNSVTSFRTNFERVATTGLGRLSAVKLEKLVLAVNIDEVGPYAIHFLNSQSNLKHFELNCQYWFIPASLNDVLLQDFLPRNASTLQNVNLFGIIHDVSWILQYAHGPLQSLDLVLINTNNLVRLLPRTTLVPKPIALLPQLARLSIVSYFGTPNNTNPNGRPEQLLAWLVTHAPNLQELDLIFRCLYVFTPQDMHMLLYGLKQLKVLCIHEPDLAALNEYCNGTPGIKCSWVLRETDHREYLFQIHVDRAVWGK